MASLCPSEAVLPGYKRVERRVLSVYPPVSAALLVNALGGGRYDGGMPMMGPPEHFEVRVSSQGNIELWASSVVREEE